MFENLYAAHLIESRARIAESERKAHFRAMLGPAPEVERPRLFGRQVRPLLATIEVARDRQLLSQGPTAA